MTNFVPLMVLGGLYLFSLGLNVATHGKPRSPNNAWYCVISILMEIGIWWWFLSANRLL